MKKELKNDLLLYPCPVLLVTAKYKNTENVFTVSWAGIACSHPEYITISIKPSRFSYSIIQQSGCFTVNIVNEKLLPIADYCGTFSGKNHDKFTECKLTKVPGHTIDVPLIEECPINIECQVEQIIKLGSHDLFIGKVLCKLIDSNIDIRNMHTMLTPLTYFRPNYYALNDNCLGTYGKSFGLTNRSISENQAPKKL